MMPDLAGEMSPSEATLADDELCMCVQRRGPGNVGTAAAVAAVGQEVYLELNGEEEAIAVLKAYGLVFEATSILNLRLCQVIELGGL